MGKEIITATQEQIVSVLSDDSYFQEHFYLSGGTALAGFYLHHRYSEDLDFFSEKEFDVSGIDVLFRKNKDQLGIAKIDYEQSFNRNLFFLHLPDEVVKTEFTYFPFPHIEEPGKFLEISVDGLMDIAVNKLFTIYQRSTARDYIDLYFIVQEKRWSIKDLIAKAKVKFDFHVDPLQLGTQFLKAEDVTDYPRMIVECNNDEWRKFFRGEAEKLKNEIVK